MGLFDKVLGKDSSPIKLSKTEGLAAIAVAAISADGDIGNEEAQRAAIDLATLKAFRNHDFRQLVDTLNKTAGIIKKRGTGPVMSAAKGVLSLDERQAAFFAAADLALADGLVESEEKKFLEELQQTLEIDEATSLKIVEVVLIKNKA